MSLKDYLNRKMGMRIPWQADGDKPPPTQQFSPNPDSMLPARDSPHESMIPARGGLKASELPRPDPCCPEIENPSSPGDRSMMARLLDKIRGGPTDSQPFGQQQHLPGYAGGMEMNEPVVNEPVAAYPMTRSRQDEGFMGSGKNVRPTTPMAVGDPTGKGRW